MFESWPFTNFHDMNLDWIINRIKNVENAEASAEASATAAAASQVDAANSAEQAANSAEEAANSAADSATSAASVEGVVEQVNANTESIANIVATAGDGTIPSELSDIRIGYDGYNWTSAGNAVRGQVSVLEDLEGSLQYTTATGYYSANGAVENPSSSAEVRTVEFTRVTPGSKILVNLCYNESHSMWMCVVEYNKYKKAVARPTASGTGTHFHQTFTLSDETEYVRLAWRSYNDIEFCNIQTGNNIESDERERDVLEQVEGHITGSAGYEYENLLQFNTLETTSNGVHLTVDSDTGVVTAAGTATSNTVFDYATFTPEEDGQYILTGMPAIENNAVISYIQGTNYYDTGSGAVYNLTADAPHTLRMVVYNGNTVDLSIRPNLQKVGDSYVKTNLELTRETGLNDMYRYPLKSDKYYDHLFINELNESQIIPNGSLASITFSKRLGFNVIEANTNKTSDGVWYVMHGISSGGQMVFGEQFVHIDGVTDISNTPISSVTSDYIENNVRYNTAYGQYRTAPPTLEAYLKKCAYLNMTPLVQVKDPSVYELVNSIMGPTGWIAYNGERKYFKGCTMSYTRYSTITEMMRQLRNFGPPHIHIFSNTGAELATWSDDTLDDIVKSAHAEGYKVGIVAPYANPSIVHRFALAGFDIFAAGHEINNTLVSGTICNIVAENTFETFNHGGVVSDGVLTLQNGDTLQLINTYEQVFTGAQWLEITYEGYLDIETPPWSGTLYGFRHNTPQTLCLNCYLLRQAPYFMARANGVVKITEIKFKASEV